MPGRLPDRGSVPDRVRHGGGAAGHLQRLRLLRAWSEPFGLDPLRIVVLVDEQVGDGLDEAGRAADEAAGRSAGG
jgi:hypothetical protein